MKVQELIGKLVKDGEFNFVVNGITFSGTATDGDLAITKIEVKPEQVKDIVLAHIAQTGVDVSGLTYHEFIIRSPDYDVHEFAGVQYERQTRQNA